MGKASVKRYVLSADLKEERVGETLMWEGSEFQRGTYRSQPGDELPYRGPPGLI